MAVTTTTTSRRVASAPSRSHAVNSSVLFGGNRIASSSSSSNGTSGGVHKKKTTLPATEKQKTKQQQQQQHASPLAAHDVTAPTPLAPTPVPSTLPLSPAITDFQRRVYTALLQIPQGTVGTYAGLAAALGSAPRAVGGALRRNPWAPDVPCHRIVKNDGYIGGFMGDMHAAPSGVNCQRKLQLLAGEGVFFDAKGFMKDRGQLWDGFKV